MGTPQPAHDDDHALWLMLAVVHGWARFVDEPEGRADVDLVACEWDGQLSPAGYPDEAATPYPAPPLSTAVASFFLGCPDPRCDLLVAAVAAKPFTADRCCRIWSRPSSGCQGARAMWAARTAPPGGR